MMTYNEMKEIAERYGIGISCQKRNCGGFMDEAGGSVKRVSWMICSVRLDFWREVSINTLKLMRS